VRKSKQLTYSQALTEIEGIISEIESAEINVDVLSEKVSKAADLIKFCKGKLRNTEEEVKKVLSGIEKTAEEDCGETT
jgi:exodeoxyribonuclease VII small subunit